MNNLHDLNNLNIFNNSNECPRKHSQQSCYTECTEECETECNTFGEGTEEEEICDKKCESTCKEKCDKNEVKDILDYIKVFLKNTTSNLPIAILEFYLLLYIVTMDIEFIVLFIMNLLLGFFLNYLLKIIFRLMDAGDKFTSRPSTCGKCGKYSSVSGKCIKDNIPKNECSGCGTFAECGTKSSSPGFPSTNSQIITMNIIYWSIYIFKGDNKSTDLFQVVFLLFILFLSCWEKIMTCCESFIQVGFGLLFGAATGIGMYFIVQMLNLKHNTHSRNKNVEMYGNNSNNYKNLNKVQFT